ncbi:16S rRNA G966 N2-methylase RsmD [Lachnospiraceae bacterium PF1-22]
MLKDNYYPTPDSLLRKIFSGVQWHEVNTVLEPSAGDGAICDYIKQMTKQNFVDPDIDCIEIDSELRNLLTGKGYRVVHDDFLTFQTRKNYDLIAMNPPFDNGDKHLLKALQMQVYGGNIVCILNAETIRNPFSNVRKDLANRLEELNASIEYFQEAFMGNDVDRMTTVEIAVIKVVVPAKEQTSSICEGLKKKYFSEKTVPEYTELAENDYIKALATRYRMEEEMGIALIREYKEMKPFILDSLADTIYSRSILQLSLDHSSYEITENEFIKKIRQKYWRTLFGDTRFTGKMTSQMRQEYDSKLLTLVDYDFSLYNIKCIQESMTRQTTIGIEESIYSLFEDLTNRFAQYDGSKNLHYYNGWKTNKAWIINKKVILPSYAYDYIWKELRVSSYKVVEAIQDIEKALSYLDGYVSDGQELSVALDKADKEKKYKDIKCAYFNLTFYKKGTVHITFTDDDLLKKLNIYGSRRKGWLPPSYGKKSYKDMSKEEQVVIDEFEGKKSYENVFANKEHYIVETGSILLSEELSA